MEQSPSQIPGGDKRYRPQGGRGFGEHGESIYMEGIKKWAKVIAEHRKMIDEERVFMKEVANSGKDIAVISAIIEKCKQRIAGFEETIKGAEGEIDKIRKENEKEIT